MTTTIRKARAARDHIKSVRHGGNHLILLYDLWPWLVLDLMEKKAIPEAAGWIVERPYWRSEAIRRHLETIAIGPRRDATSSLIDVCLAGINYRVRRATETLGRWRAAPS